MGIGSRLKEAREGKDISLDSLQETTKIQKRYLRAIEEENYDVLPGKFYARAFIKEYALAVDLDVDELFEDFKDELPQSEAETDTQYPQIQKTRKERNLSQDSRVFSLIPTIIVVLLVVGIIFAVWFFMFEKSPSDANEEVSQVEEQDNQAIIRSTDKDDSDTEDKNSGNAESDNNNNAEDKNDANENDEKEEDLELTKVEGKEDNSETTFELNNVKEKLELTLNSSGETWLEIENKDGKELFSGMLTSEDSPLDIDVIDEKEIYFNVGNASALDIQFNDLDLEYPTNPNKDVVQRFWVHIK